MADNMDVNGFVRLHRSMLGWEWYRDDACKVLMVHLLLNVNWKDGRFRGQDVPAGTVVTSIERISGELGWTRARTRRTFDKLKLSGEVTSTTTNHWTSITLVNWAKYQDSDQQGGQPKRQQKSNRKPTASQQPATIEEGKEREEVKKRDMAMLFSNAECSDVEKAKAALPDFVAEGIDLAAYAQTIRNWSDVKNEMRTERGWLATYRTFIAKDRESGKVKMVPKKTVWQML